jgi:hypothetical protein
VLNGAIQAIVQDAKIKKEIADEGGEVGATTAPGFADIIESERMRWSGAVRESGVPRDC